MFTGRILARTPRRSTRLQSLKAINRAHTDLRRIVSDFDSFYPVQPEVGGADLSQRFVQSALPSFLVCNSGKTQRKLEHVKIGFIGWGSMAQAISTGLLSEAATVPEQIMVSGRREEVLAKAEKEGIASSLCNKSVAGWADIVVVAVKPQMLDNVMPELAAVWHKDKLLVSVCAGVSIDTFLQMLGSDAKVVRTMPNTPCMIGEAATAYAGSDRCHSQDLELVEKMFDAVGKATHKVPEHLMDAVTGVSGSGPAYVYMMIQAMSDAGVHSGLPRDVSLSLATQTVIGAAKMVQSSGKHPMVLKEAVTSPAGTTIAGVKALEEAGLTAAVMQAVHAAKSRAEDLSQLKPKRSARSRAQRPTRRRQ
eukprot:TRINITY_DN48838_c0_g1_i1.p1 TRINITY_DN48838_c0_g1~~TRINITY_DN48838_c0_g1_i1.p1  ORF type:complete len:390 (+),score=62.83 TRINITY_DN48838_c0_g1_i1:79-1170(+)